MINYTITKSMNRHERYGLALKLYSEMLSNGYLYMVFAQLEYKLAQKKKKRLYGNRKNMGLHVIKLFKYKAIKVYCIITKNKGIDVVFDTSPVDYPYIEYTRISPTGMPIIYTQHLLDRYNERVCKDRFTRHKDVMIEIFTKNPKKANIVTGENNHVVQRIDEGFVLGKLDSTNKYIVFNTFYDSAEYRDNEIKQAAREAKQFQNNLLEKQIKEYNTLLFLYQTGHIGTTELQKQIRDKGLF